MKIVTELSFPLVPWLQAIIWPKEMFKIILQDNREQVRDESYCYPKLKMHYINKQVYR